MSVIRVNPESVRAYGNTASQQFGLMRAELEKLTRDVVNVRYFGPNAENFKTQCGILAVSFANALIADLTGIAQAVRASTTNISSALGGGSVDIVFDGSPVPPPEVPAAGDFVDVDTSALEALVPVINGSFSNIEEALTRHLNVLTETDWVGTAKQGAVDVVNQFTVAARSKATEAQLNLNTAITDQVSSVLAADK